VHKLAARLVEFVLNDQEAVERRKAVREDIAKMWVLYRAAREAGDVVDAPWGFDDAPASVDDNGAASSAAKKRRACKMGSSSLFSMGPGSPFRAPVSPSRPPVKIVHLENKGSPFRALFTPFRSPSKIAHLENKYLTPTDTLSPTPFFKNVKCVRETEILVEQQPPQGVVVCDHAGLVINKFSPSVIMLVL